MNRVYKLISLIGMLSLSITTNPFAEEEEEQIPDIGCINCHIEMGGDSEKLVYEWLDSYHAEYGNTCDGCHGGNPKTMDMDVAMSPEAGFVGIPDEKDIPAFCGKCHDGVRQKYMKSGHAIALGQDVEVPSCVYCHGSHGVQKARAHLINEEKCSVCHEYDRALEIKGAMSEVELDIETKLMELAEIKAKGIQPSGLEDRLFDTRNTFHRISHELNVGVVLSITGEMKEKLSEIEQTMDEARAEIKKRRIIGVIFIAFCFVVVLLLSAYRKTYG